MRNVIYYDNPNRKKKWLDSGQPFTLTKAQYSRIYNSPLYLIESEGCTL